MERGGVPLNVGLAGAAAVCGVSYDYLQRHWRQLVDEAGFPPPYLGWSKGKHPRWATKRLAEWIEGHGRGERAVGIGGIPQLDAPKPAANDAVRKDFLAADDPVAALLAAAGG